MQEALEKCPTQHSPKTVLQLLWPQCRPIDLKLTRPGWAWSLTWTPRQEPRCSGQALGYFRSFEMCVCVCVFSFALVRRPKASTLNSES